MSLHVVASLGVPHEVATPPLPRSDEDTAAKPMVDRKPVTSAAGLIILRETVMRRASNVTLVESLKVTLYGSKLSRSY
jgi:hypothetical protein